VKIREGRGEEGSGIITGAQETSAAGLERASQSEAVVVSAVKRSADGNQKTDAG